MAVDIPVIIDIDKAFQDAAKRVSSAIKPMQKAVDENTLEVIVEINKKGDVAEVFDFVSDGKKSMAELKYAIKSVESQLESLYAKKGGSVDLASGEGKALTEAHIILTQILAQRNNITQAVKKSTQEVLNEAQAEREHQAALRMTENSLNNLNAKAAAWNKELNSATINSNEFKNAAINATILSEKLEMVSNQIRIIGSAPGSLNELNAKLQEINRQFNAMDSTDRSGAKGKALLDRYRTVSSEIQKAGKSLQQMVQEEQRLAQMVQKGANQRKYENAILNSTVKSMRVLQEQERILSDRLNRTVIGSSAYERLKKQLRDVRVEIQNVNMELNGGNLSNFDSLLGKTDNKLASIVKRSAQLVALHSATSFIRNVRQVTSEFEMQRVALAGIIQDTAQAEQLFKQLKAAAIKSPFEIKDLVSFTKQLSAYRIETDKLFDVTMQLADVSAGLGVDMSRLVLAYGQVRAAAVLRGQELRQFTEAGIPLVDKLAEKFTELKNRTVSAAEVFDLISKRAVSFSMVEEIFNDMTSAGGEFYNMQEKQSETLLGQWQKLKDALSIMYDEIGNTSTVHSAMESMMADAMSLMQNWRLLAGVVKAVGIQFVSLKALSVVMPSLARNAALAKKSQDAFNRSLAAAEMAARTGSKSFERTSNNLLRMSTYLEKASMTTNAFKQVWYRLAAAMAGGAWIGIVITALTALIGYIVSARKEAERLRKEVFENIGKGETQITQAERNFKRLADAAVQAADGSYEQREALKELQRSYGDVIPSQDLQIQKLRELNGEYSSLTDAIRQKIEMQVHEQNMNQISENYGGRIGAQRKGLEKFLKEEGKYTAEETTRIIGGINDAIKEGLLSTQTELYKSAEIIEKIIEEQTGNKPDFGFGEQLMGAHGFLRFPYYENLLKITEKFNASIEEEEQRFKDLNNTMGRYSLIYKEIQNEINKAPEGFTLDQAGTFEFNEAKWKQKVAVFKEKLIEAFDGIDISSAFDANDIIDFNEIFKHVSTGEGTRDLKKFVGSLQKDYLNAAPQEATTRLVTQAAKKFADGIGIEMSRVQGYLKNDGANMEQYAKSVEDFVKEQKNRVKELEFSQSNFINGISNYVRPSDEDIAKEKEELSFLEKMLEFVKDFLKEKNKGGGYQQDPWILIYKNRMKFMQEFRNGVEDLNKYMTKSQSLAKEQSIMEGRGALLGFDVKKLDGSREEMLRWYDDTIAEITNKIQQLGGKAWSGLGVQAILAKDTKSRTIKAWQDLLQEVFKGRTDFDLSQTKKDLEKEIKKVKEELKRSETARNFYKDILDLTGDEQLAATMSVSVYGGIGDDFKNRMQQQLNAALASLDADKITDEMRDAFKNQDFGKILDNIDLWGFSDEWKSVLMEMAESNQKYNADLVKSLMKSLEKAKTYGEKQVEIAKKSAQRVAEINSLNVSQPVKDQMLKQNAKKEAEETASAMYEAFKDSDTYIELFDNLDGASTRMLNSMRDNLLSLKDVWNNLSPRELRELQSKLNELDEQIATRNPFKAMVDSLKEYRDLTKEASRAEIEESAVSASETTIRKKQELEVAKQYYNTMVSLFGIESQQAKFAERRLNAKKNEVDLAIKEEEKARKLSKSLKDAAKHIDNAAAGMQKWAGYINQALGGIGDIVSTFSSDDFSDTFNIISDGIGKTMGGLATTAGSAAKLMANPADITAWVSLIEGVGQAIEGIFGTASQLKIKSINKKIDEQQDIIDNLSGAYEKLEKAMEKAFGSDYIYNYNKQLENLAAQQAAYEEQARLEREKGKKKDDEKIKEYEKNAKDAAESMEEMYGKLAEHFTGTDVASSARDLANAWIDAYKSFSSTTDAMKEKFNDMIQNMVTESLAAKLMQTILDPLFKEIDDMALSGGELTADEIAKIANEAPGYIEQINAAMSGLMNQLAAAGYNVRQSASGFTGISRDIAGASEESINGLAAGINTQNFYMQLISQNVAAILAAMTGEAVEGSTGATTPDPYREQILEYVSTLPQMRTDIYAIRSMLEKVIRPNGTTATHYVATKI